MDLDAVKAYLNKSKADKEADQKRRNKFGENDRRMAFPPLLSSEVHTLRILPPLPGEPLPAMVVLSHKNLIAEGEKPDSKLNCAKMHGLECDICNVIEKYESDMDVGDWLVDARAYFNVLVIDGKDLQKNTCDPTLPYIYGGKRGMLDWICDKLLNPNYGDITDAKSGFAMTVQREKDYGKFDYNILPRATAIHSDPMEAEKILEARYDLKKIWRSPDDAYLSRLKKAANLLEGKLSVMSKALSSNKATDAGTLPETPSSPKQ